MSPSSRKIVFVLLTLFVSCVIMWHFFGLYSVQPIGALPEGRTLLVRRTGDEPFFNSADARCLERVGSVSLLCRMAALAAGPTDRIVLRLPYMHWAYLASTGGRDFDR